MKRSYEDADTRDGRRRRGGNEIRSRYCFKVLCTESLTSFLLGAKGAKKDEIQSESGSKLVFSNKGDYFPDSPYRVLGVYSEDSPNIMRAMELIMPKIIELGDEEHQRPPAPGSELAGKEPGEYIFRLAVSKQTGGLLIGSGGANVQALRKDTGCKVIIDKDTVMQHRLVRLIGSPEAMLQCLDRINEFVQRDIGGEEYEAFAKLINFSEAGSGGWGEPGGGGKGHRDDFFKGDFHKGDFHKGKGGGKGGGKAGGKPPAPAAPQLSGHMMHELDALSEVVGSMPPGTQDMPYSVTCALPMALVGALVGRAGEYVKRVEEDTGAKIDIAREGDGDSRLMSVIGPLMGVYAAHAAMMQRLQVVEMGDERPRQGAHNSGVGTEDEDPAKLRLQIAELQRKLDSAKGSGKRVW